MVRALSALASLSLAGLALGQVSFEFLGFLPGGQTSHATGVSADGLFVAGTATSFDGQRAFVWTHDSGILSLGTLPGDSDSFGQAISADGRTIVGSSRIPAIHDRACRWVLGHAPEDLDPRAGNGGSVAMGVSADGRTVAGGSYLHNVPNGPGIEAGLWPGAGGFLHLGCLPGGYLAFASGISADGSTIVGSSDTTQAWDKRAFRWTAATGLQNLGTPLPNTTSWGNAVSGDGSVVVGNTNGAVVRPFRWTALRGMELLPCPNNYSAALCVNSRGTAAGGSSPARLWTTRGGFIDLTPILTAAGINLDGWALNEVTGISDDGVTIIGNAFRNGLEQGWIARLPPAILCDANCDSSTITPFLNIGDFICFLTRFTAGDEWANCDGSTAPPVLNVADFVCFVNRFAAGCP